MKSLNRQFNLTVIGVIAYVVGVVALYIYLFGAFPNSAWVYVTLFIALFVFMFILTYIQVRFEQLTTLKAKHQIQEHAEPEKHSQKAFNLKLLTKNLLEDGFTLHQQTEQYTMLYRISQDEIRKIRRQYILEVVVYLNENNTEFYLEEVDDEMDKIKDIAQKDRKRLHAILISQYRPTSMLTSKTKEQLLENIFIRTRYNVYSVINIALDKSTNKAVFLHSRKYSPSLYYTKQVDHILKNL